MLHLLLVEDDSELASSLIDFLEQKELQCDHASDAVTALNLLKISHYDVIVLDLALQESIWLDLCESIQADGNETPLLMLLPANSCNATVASLHPSHYDYLSKPFELEELLERIIALTHSSVCSAKKHYFI